MGKGQPLSLQNDFVGQGSFAHVGSGVRDPILGVAMNLDPAFR